MAEHASQYYGSIESQRDLMVRLLELECGEMPFSPHSFPQSRITNRWRLCCMTALPYLGRDDSE